jgi:hypothetical protein
VASFRAGWKASALPAGSAPAAATETDQTSEKQTTTVQIRVTSPLDDSGSQLDALAMPPLTSNMTQ